MRRKQGGKDKNYIVSNGERERKMQRKHILSRDRIIAFPALLALPVCPPQHKEGILSMANICQRTAEF